MDNDCKKCKTCGSTKPINEFYKSSIKYYSYQCKKCHCAYTKKWRKKNKDKCAKHARKSHFKHMYKISENDFDQMFKEQNGVCKICEKAPSSNKHHQTRCLHVDHDHKTGKVRGLLCHLCNRGLGYFQDSPNLLHKAYQYLL